MSLNNIGLAYKAKKVILGTDLVISNINKITLVLLASDANLNTIRKITNKTKLFNIPINDLYSKEELSKAIGKYNVSVIGVTDRGFLNLLKKKGS